MYERSYRGNKEQRKKNDPGGGRKGSDRVWYYLRPPRLQVPSLPVTCVVSEHLKFSKAHIDKDSQRELP